MKNKYIIGIICAIVLVSSISTIFGMMYFGNTRNSNYQSINQISGYNNMIRNDFYTSTPYSNHMNVIHFSHMGNNFHNNIMTNNFNHMRQININGDMMYNY